MAMCVITQTLLERCPTSTGQIGSWRLRIHSKKLSMWSWLTYNCTPPALNFYTRSALIAADSCLIPFDCDAFSRAALYELMQNVDEIQADHNEALRVEGIVVNQYQPRASLPQRVVQELIDEGLPVLQPYLGSSVKIKESHERALPLVHLEPGHRLSQSYQALYQALQG